jgi:REP element-mobilizing transposase RayT
MPNTYYKMYVQTVFAVKRRNALLEEPWRSKMQGVIGELIKQAGGHTIIVNGVEDHLHCFFSMKPSLSVSDMMQAVKGKSSKWFNEQRFVPERFEWQEGFGCFTYSHSQVDQVYRYIANQERHHQSQTFSDEYVQMLRAFDIAYDEQYLFHSPL